MLSCREPTYGPRPLRACWPSMLFPDDLIDLAFSKKRADDRKEWLRGFVEGTHVDYGAGVERLLVSDFISKELILFSRADNVRSLPSVLDGLKPAQRKVLYACFKRNLKADIKVAQLAGYVSEHAAYHHGEAALGATIVGMAQDFVGSNNAPLLVPSGQFGTRLQGGKDCASPRYIFTRLSPLARAIFHADDDALLRYGDDDGQPIEPAAYVPIVPLVLLNGADGIGTGWSTSVPNYNPRDVIAAIRAMLDGSAPPELHPWYRGFTGTIDAKKGTGAAAGSYIVRGVGRIAADGEKLVVTELPIGRWTQDYKAMLVSFVTGEWTLGGNFGGGARAGAEEGAAGAAAKKAPAVKGIKGKSIAGKPKPAAKKAAAGKPAASKSTIGADADESAIAASKAKRAAAAKRKAAAADDDDDDDVDELSVDDDDGSDFDADACSDDGADDDVSVDDSDSDAGGKKTGAAGKKDPDALVLPPGEPLIKEFFENHTDTTVSFTIIPAAPLKDYFAAAAAAGGELTVPLRKLFRLDGTLSTSNMHLFDADGAIKRYATPADILTDFIAVRRALYAERKAHLIAVLGDDVERLANRARFILAVVRGELRVSNRRKAELLAELHDAGYKGFEPAAGAAASAGDDAQGADDDGAAAGISTGIGGNGSDLPVALLSRRYAYLLSQPLWSLTMEKVDALRAELAGKEGKKAHTVISDA